MHPDENGRTNRADENSDDSTVGEQRTPEEDPFACSACGCYLSTAKRVAGDDYCDVCLRDYGVTLD